MALNFSKIIGQDRAVSLLRADIESGRIAESYLFTGSQGIGKRFTALKFAKAVNCKMNDPSPVPSAVTESQIDLLALPPVNPSQESVVIPCNVCSSCHKISSGTHPDFFLLNFETQAKLLDLNEEEKLRQKDYKVESVRKLVNQSYLSPMEARKKFFVIDGAEYLNAESANALLKVLEESPKLCHWILLAVSSERIIQTVRSRCRIVSFSPLSPENIETILFHLKSASLKDLKESEKVREVSKIADGSVAVALELLEEDSQEFIQIAERILNQLEKSPALPQLFDDSLRIVKESKKGNARVRAESFLKVISLKMSGRLRLNPVQKNAERMATILQSLEELRRNVSPQLVLDALFLSFLSNNT